MKGFAVIVALALCHVAMGDDVLTFGLPMQNVIDPALANRAFEQTIIDLIECVRVQMNIGFPNFGIPHLNPLVIEDHTFDYSEAGIEGISGLLNIQGTVFAGLTRFILSDVKGTIGLIPPSYTIEIKLTFPDPALSTNYHNELTAGDYYLDGEGTLDFEANNFVADVSLRATILGGIGLSYFTLVPSMDELTSFVITGVRNDEALSQEVSDNILNHGSAIMDAIAPTITDIVEQAILNLVNNGGGEEGGFLSELLDLCLGS